MGSRTSDIFQTVEPFSVIFRIDSNITQFYGVLVLRAPCLFVTLQIIIFSKTFNHKLLVLLGRGTHFKSSFIELK